MSDARLWGSIAGALVFTFLWSRLWLWLAGRFAPDAYRIAVAFALAWASAMILGALGFADGGPLNWSRAFMSYTPALALWLVVEILAATGRKGRQKAH